MPAPTSSPIKSPPESVILVDFENVPTVDLAPIKGRAARVILLLGKNQTKLDVKLVEQIKQFHAQVELVRLEHSGRNALDITLAFYLGRAAERTPEAEFVIVSKDRDYGPLIAHLMLRGVKIARHETLSDVPSLSGRSRQSLAAPPVSVAPTAGPRPAAVRKVPAAPKATPDRAARIAARLRNPDNRNRPAKLATLRAHVKTALGKEATDDMTEAVIQKLRQDRILDVQPDDTITYST